MSLEFSTEASGLPTDSARAKTHAPISVRHNPYHVCPKRSDIYTPPPVAKFIFDLLRGHPYQTVLDPAIGQGALTAPWRAAGRTVVGCDIDPASEPYADLFLDGPFEAVASWDAPRPDIAVVNSPFNGAPRGELYPEVFLSHLVALFGTNFPIVLFTPMGLRLNQRQKSRRWRWLRDCGLEITSLLALPLDVFPDVEFHLEVVFFNVPNIAAHYFLSPACEAELRDWHSQREKLA